MRRKQTGEPSCQRTRLQVTSALHLYINALELLAAGKAIAVLRLEQVFVTLATDNVVTAAAICRQGACSMLVQKVAQLVFELAWAKCVSLRASRIPGILNVVAHSSRDHPITTEWELPMREFQRLVRLRGQVEIICLRLVSITKFRILCLCLFEYPEAIAVDAFTVEWTNWNQI